MTEVDTPVRRPRLASLKADMRRLDRQAASGLRAQILAGHMPPGMRLLETELADELEVSRGTVRSALATLAHEGLVRQVAFTKWEIPGVTPADAWELYTLRGALEGLAARIGATRATGDDRVRLKGHWKSLVAAVGAGRYPEATEADFSIHETIVAMARHRRLAEQHRVVIQQVRFVMVHSGFLPKDYTDLIDDHRALIDSVVAGDAERAEALAQNHNRTEIELLTEALMNRDSDAA